MPYYPSSQVKTNLYTNGDEFTDSRGAPYVGYYFINSKGETYTGKTPQDTQVRRLYAAPNSDNENPVYIADKFKVSTPDGNYSFYNIDYPYYDAIGRDWKQSTKAPLKPIQEINIPTENDYNIGEFQRYFLRKNNEIQFIEVNFKQYQLFLDQNQKVQWQTYTPIQISWVIVGDLENVYNTNKNIVKLYETRNRMVGFVSYFNNRFAKFCRKETEEERSTSTPTSIIGGY